MRSSRTISSTCLSYFPFGAGPRICIGEGFAWMEAVLIVATIAQRWRLELVSDDVMPQASITLRPRGGMGGGFGRGFFGALCPSGAAAASE